MNDAYYKMDTRRQQELQMVPSRLSDRPFVVHPEQQVPNGFMTDTTFRRQVSGEFRFLEEEPYSGANYKANDKKLERATKRRLVGKMFAIIFCVCEVLIALGLLVFGAIRISAIASQGQGDLSMNIHRSRSAASRYRTAGVCIEDSMFLAAAGVVGIIAFVLNSLGLCVVHMALAVVSVTFSLYAVLTVGQDIAIEHYYSGGDGNIGLEIPLTALVTVACLIFLATTLIQTSYMLSPSPAHYKVFPTAPLVFCVLTIGLCTILVPLSAVGLKNAIDYSPQSHNVSESVYLSKIEMSSAPLVSGLYTLAVSAFGIVACVYKSRSLLLSALLFLIPTTLVLMDKVLVGFATLIPDLASPTYVAKDYTEIYTAIFVMSFIVQIGTFFQMAVVGGHVYKKRSPN